MGSKSGSTFWQSLRGDGPATDTSNTAEVPTRVVETLLVDVAIATAHLELCGHAAPGIRSMSGHPGDPFGRVLAWLWSSGRKHAAVELVAGYLVEMRQHNPHSPAPGHRLRWEQLRRGIPLSIVSADLPTDNVQEMLAYLDEHLPGVYGQSLTELNTA